MRPDWDQSPAWANFAAQELSGSFYWHELKPVYQELTGEWRSKGRTEILPKVVYHPLMTLEERPAPAYVPPDPYDLCAMRETALMRGSE